jgi:hypothetical protein
MSPSSSWQRTLLTIGSHTKTRGRRTPNSYLWKWRLGTRGSRHDLDNRQITTNQFKKQVTSWIRMRHRISLQPDAQGGFLWINCLDYLSHRRHTTFRSPLFPLLWDRIWICLLPSIPRQGGPELAHMSELMKQPKQALLLLCPHSTVLDIYLLIDFFFFHRTAVSLNLMPGWECPQLFTPSQGERGVIRYKCRWLQLFPLWALKSHAVPPTLCLIGK